MSEPPDLDALAKQYLDLWQQQLGGISKDQQTAEIMAQTMELMNAGASAFATMATQNQGYADADASSSPSAAASVMCRSSRVWSVTRLMLPNPRRSSAPAVSRMPPRTSPAP